MSEGAVMIDTRPSPFRLDAARIVPFAFVASALFMALPAVEHHQACAQAYDRAQAQPTKSRETSGRESNGNEPHGRGAIGGLVVNGSDGDQPLAGAEVVLRRIDADGIAPVATTKTDEHGHFAFLGLPAEQETWYVPGVNRDGVHYPGSRVPITPETPAIRVRLTAYDGLTDPSPLVALRHVIQVRVNRAARTLEVSESIRVANPSPRGYIGQAPSGESPVTLNVRPLPGFERVVFADEFLARSFQVRDGALTTDLPWPPGSREIAISYELPITGRSVELIKPLDLPCGDVQLEVLGAEPGAVDARIVSDDLSDGSRDGSKGNLIGVPLSSSPAEFRRTYQGAALPQGHVVRLSLTSLPVSPLSYAKWLAMAVLVVGIGWGARRLQQSKHKADGKKHEETRISMPV